MDAGDAEFLAALDAGEAPPGGFGHRAHLRLAWVLLERDGPERGGAGVEARLRRLAAAHGAPDHYHHTLTLFWVGLVRHVMAHRPPASSFDEFASGAGWLLDPKLPGRHYSRELLWGDAARRAWVAPDLAGLPA